MKLTSRTLNSITAGAIVCAAALNASATPTWLVLRAGCAMPICNGVTVQTLDTNFGTNPAVLPFAGTTIYQFYSPPVTQAVSLATSDKGGGVIYMQNTAPTNTYDFSVTGEMAYYDYDPKTGTQTLIVDTGASAAKNVNHNENVNWPVPNAALASNYTIPTGHMVHMTLTITLVSGNPGSYGEMIYNGPQGPCTTGYLPQSRPVALAWPFGSSAMYGAAATIVSIKPQTNGGMLLSCAGAAATTYSIQSCTNLAAPVWTIIGTTISDSNGLFSFVDAGPCTLPCCFYRTMTTP